MTNRAWDARLVRVLCAFALFSIVEFGIWGAVLLYAQLRGGDALMAGLAVIQLLGAALLAPVAGNFIDRFPRGAALRYAYALEGFLILGLALTLRGDAPIWIVAAVGVLVTSSVSTVRPIHYAVLPQLSPSPAALVRSNSISGGLEGVGLIVGFVLSGLLRDTGGSAFSAFVFGAMILISAGLTVGVRLAHHLTDGGDVESGGLMWQSIKTVSRDPGLLTILLLIGLTYLITQALELIGISFATQVLGGNGLDQGLLAGIEGAGALVGSAIAVTLVLRSRLALPLCTGLALAGVPLVVMTRVGALAPAAGLLMICGVGVAYSVVAGRTLLQRAVDDALLARVFSLQEGVILIGQAAGAAVPIVLLNMWGPATSYLPLGIAMIVIAGVAYPIISTVDRRTVINSEILRALLKVPFLRALPPPGIERLAHAAHWVEVTAGEVIINQGEQGDAFYVIAEGSFSVSVDGRPRDHTLNPGDGFGEIALLHDVARTATITAITDGRLLRIERDDFLATVTGLADGQQVAAEVAAAHLERDREVRPL